jgi:outer membrane receptor protein involved in Fe transport
MNKRSHFVFLALAIGFILTLGDVSALFAQETKADEFTLEEITVTAQKRAENQQKVPIAMETITGDTIKELGKTDIDQILSTISSVIINKATDGMRVTLRGMSNDNDSFQGRQVSTPSVAVNMDGSYTNRSAAGDNLFDIERVEVLYGPQSTMYSTASPGGVVNVVTASPKLEKFETSAILEAGNYSLKHIEAVVNVPVANKFAFRVAGNYTKRDGYLTNGADDEDTKTARLKALFQATDKLSVTGIVEYSKQGGQGMGQNGVNLFDKQSDVANPWTAAAGMGQSTAGPQPSNNGVNKKYSGRIDWDLGIGSLAIVPSYTPRDGDSTDTGTDRGTGAATYTNNYNAGSEKSIEARMTSSTDFTLFKWIFGATYYKSHDERKSDTFFTATNAADGYNFGYQDQTSRAVFGNVTIPVTDRFRTTGGLRYTKEKTFSYMFESSRDVVPETVDMEYSSPDYKVGVEYDMAENSMLYSDFSTSYRTQGMGTTATGKPFPAEKLKAFTVGSKNRFLNNRMQVNVSAYYYKYNNYMAVTGIGSVVDNYAGAYDSSHTYAGVDPNTLTPLQAVNGTINGNGHLDYVDNNQDGKYTAGVDTLLDGQANAGGGGGPAGPGQNGANQDPNGKTTGDMKVYGVDLSTTTLVTQDFKVDLSLSYLKKYFTSLVFTIQPVTQEFWDMSAIDYSGMDATFSPHWTANATFTYTIPLWNGGTLSPEFDTRYQTSYKMYFLNQILGTDRVNGQIVKLVTDVTKSAVQEPYHLSNFSMVYADPTGKWTLTGYVKNIEDYAVKRSVFSNGPNGLGELTIGPPRTFGGILSVKF